MKYPETNSVVDLGRVDTAAHTGAVDDTTKAMGYHKQNVTNTESILTILGGSAIQMRTAQSISAAVEENALQQFSISIMDVDTGAVASASIDITGISAVIEKSTGGGAFSAAGLTAITFGKEDGRVFVDYQFKAAEWTVGDVYKIVVSGITATIGGDTAYVPAMVWSNFIVEDADLKAAVDAINTDLGDWSARSNLVSLLTSLGIPDTSGKPLYTCLVTDRLDSATYGLSALNDDADAILEDIGDFSARTNNLKSLLAVLGVPDVDDDTLYKLLITDRLDSATYGLEAIKNAVTTGSGAPQIAATTIDLNQATGSYDLFTGATQDVVLESLIIKMPTEAAGGALTSIAIQTDDVTPSVLIDATDGAVGNLTSEGELFWTGRAHITVGTKIQLTIAGGAHGSTYTCKVTAQYVAITSGGVLS